MEIRDFCLKKIFFNSSYNLFIFYICSTKIKLLDNWINLMLIYSTWFFSELRLKFKSPDKIFSPDCVSINKLLREFFLWQNSESPLHFCTNFLRVQIRAREKFRMHAYELLDILVTKYLMVSWVNVAESKYRIAVLSLLIYAVGAAGKCD